MFYDILFAHSLTLFVAAIGILGGQIGDSGFLKKAFTLATTDESEGVDEDKHKWLVCDFSGKTPDAYRFRKTINAADHNLIYYRPQKEEPVPIKDKRGKSNPRTQ